jgi:hypothetical protein
MMSMIDVEYNYPTIADCLLCESAMSIEYVNCPTLLTPNFHNNCLKDYQ